MGVWRLNKQICFLTVKFCAKPSCIVSLFLQIPLNFLFLKQIICEIIKEISKKPRKEDGPSTASCSSSSQIPDEPLETVVGEPHQLPCVAEQFQLETAPVPHKNKEKCFKCVKKSSKIHNQRRMIIRLRDKVKKLQHIVRTILTIFYLAFQITFCNFGWKC